MSEHKRQALRAFERACVGIDAIVFRVQLDSCLFGHPHSIPQYAGRRSQLTVSFLILGADGHPKF